MGKDITAAILPGDADDGPRRSRFVAILAVGVVRLLADDAVKSNVDLPADIRVTTTTARPGGGDES